MAQANPTLVSGYAYGTPVFLGDIVSTTTKNNADTSSPFTIGSGKMVMIQTSAAAHVTVGTSASVTAATTDGVEMIAKEKRIFYMGDTYTHIAVVGSATTRVWELKL